MLNTPDEIQVTNDVIDFWRDRLEPTQSVFMPRPITGMNLFELLSLPPEVIEFDAIPLTKEHLDRMTNEEVIEYVKAQAHVIH